MLTQAAGAGKHSAASETLISWAEAEEEEWGLRGMRYVGRLVMDRQEENSMIITQQLHWNDTNPKI